MIGRMLRLMRCSKGFKQSELAKKLNIAQTTLSGYETNYSNPDFDMIERFANLCNFEIIFRNIDSGEEFKLRNITRKDVK